MKPAFLFPGIARVYRVYVDQVETLPATGLAFKGADGMLDGVMEGMPQAEGQLVHRIALRFGPLLRPHGGRAQHRRQVLPETRRVERPRRVQQLESYSCPRVERNGLGLKTERRRLVRR